NSAVRPKLCLLTPSSRRINSLGSNLYSLPFTPAKQRDAYKAGCGFGYEDRPINAALLRSEFQGEQVRQRYFEQPKTEEVDLCGCQCISRAVKRLKHHHSPGIRHVAVSHNPQALRARRNYRSVARKDADQQLVAKNIDQRHRRKEGHVDKTGDPN